MTYKVIQEREECIGCGACAQMCPKYWFIDSDGKASLKGAKKVGSNQERTFTTDLECNKEAANVCPVEIIKIKELKEGA